MTKKAQNRDHPLQAIIEGVADWRRWLWLGLFDVRLSNRRSVIGMWWPTLSLGIFSFGVGHLFAILMGRPLDQFLPHVVVGWLSWQLISTAISQGSSVFIANVQLLKEAMMSPSAIIFRHLTRQTMNFLQGLFVVLAAYLYVRKGISWNASYAILGLVLNLAVLHGAILFLGVLGARFRDISHIVDAGMRLAFFLTPIIWIADQALSPRSRLVEWNPFYYMLEVVRAPLETGLVDWRANVIVFVFAIIANFFGFLAFAFARRRLIYWL